MALQGNVDFVASQLLSQQRLQCPRESDDVPCQVKVSSIDAALVTLEVAGSTVGFAAIDAEEIQEVPELDKAQGRHERLSQEIAAAPQPQPQDLIDLTAEMVLLRANVAQLEA